MTRFPSEPWENRPSNDELDRRDEALEAKGDIEREDISANIGQPGVKGSSFVKSQCSKQAG